MSLCEWLAAVDGYLTSIGADKLAPPATSTDLEAFGDLALPGRSTR